MKDLSHGNADIGQRTDGSLHGISVRDALSLIDLKISRLPQERIPVLKAAGRSLAQPVVAVSAVPGFRRAAMDGYAVRFDDVAKVSAQGNVILTIIGESLPGNPYQGGIEAGQCVAISTGAVVPETTDTLARWEIVDRNENIITIRQSIEARRDIALPDEDIPGGSTIVMPPRILRPQDVGACCSAGVSAVDVVRIPRIGILSTGDELVAASGTLGPGQIIDTNSTVLRLLVERDGGNVVSPTLTHGSILPDCRSTIRESIASIVEHVDCLLVSGGTSHGRGDHAVAVLDEWNSIEFRGVRTRPGAPTTFGFANGVPVFLLPGNPVASLFAYDLFARRAVRRLAGREVEWPYQRQQKCLSRQIKSQLGRLDYVRVRCLGDDLVDPVWPRGASVLTSTVNADGFILVDEETDLIEPGASVDVYHYDHLSS